MPRPTSQLPIGHRHARLEPDRPSHPAPTPPARHGGALAREAQISTQRPRGKDGYHNFPNWGRWDPVPGEKKTGGHFYRGREKLFDCFTGGASTWPVAALRPLKACTRSRFGSSTFFYRGNVFSPAFFVFEAFLVSEMGHGGIFSQCPRDAAKEPGTSKWPK